ncbi:MAG: hypothetical protein GAK40_01439 [Burkholderia plantarii]|nr:MAG: hypothetical protein GAK40_01439 [Burkholderia plantarii]
MPILIVLLVFAALVWGAILAFRDIAAQYGTGVATGIACAVAALLAWVLAYWLRRRRDIAPNTKDGGWTHVMNGAGATLKLSSAQGLLWLSQDGAEGHYTLTDVSACQAEPAGEGWQLTLALRDTRHPNWTLPMPDRRQAERWARIVTLAQNGRL